MAEQRFRVEAAQAGERLDKLVVRMVPGLGRKAARRLFEDGKIRVNGKRPNKGDLAREGDQLIVTLPDTTGPSAVPEPEAELEVRLETEQIVIVEKPPGQPTAPLRDGETGTLANALVGRFPEMAGIGYSPREPGLLHRLDTDTSGLLLAARTPDAFDALSKALKSGAIEKKYLWFVWPKGSPRRGEIAIPIAHHPKDKKRMYAVPPSARRCSLCASRGDHELPRAEHIGRMGSRGGEGQRGDPSPDSHPHGGDRAPARQRCSLRRSQRDGARTPRAARQLHRLEGRRDRSRFRGELGVAARSCRRVSCFRRGVSRALLRCIARASVR